MIPPINFAMVDSGIYRSGHPIPKNFSFLKKLGLKSVVYLCEEPYSKANQAFLEKNGISLFHLGTHGNKEPFQFIPSSTVSSALSVIQDPSNQPILIHCNKGTHRTGCVVASLRKQQRWALTSIFAEYRRFAGSRVRVLDQQFIELL